MTIPRISYPLLLAFGVAVGMFIVWVWGGGLTP